MSYILDIKTCIIYFNSMEVEKVGEEFKNENSKNRKRFIARRLSKRGGITRQTISMIESGKYNPTLKLCIAICTELNRSLDDLFWEE